MNLQKPMAGTKYDEFSPKARERIWHCARKVTYGGDCMIIPFEEFEARLLADTEVKREYDALAPEFEAYAESLRARKSAAAKAPDVRPHHPA
jgi:hypothetical protein